MEKSEAVAERLQNKLDEPLPLGYCNVGKVIAIGEGVNDFKVGDMVEHAIFGIGKVMALSGQGENQRVGIEFKDGLKKKLVVKFANLKKVDTPEG